MLRKIWKKVAPELRKKRNLVMVAGFILMGLDMLGVKIPREFYNEVVNDLLNLLQMLGLIS